MTQSLIAALRELAERLQPSAADEARVAEARASLAATLAPLAPVEELILRGPFARGTQSLPLGRIDLLVVLRKDIEAQAPDETVRTLHEALIGTGHFLEVREHRLKNRMSLHLEQNGLALALVPAVASGPHFLIAAPDGWRLSDPRGRQAACDRADARAGGLFRPLVRLVQQWSLHHRTPLSADRLERMAYPAFGEPPPGWPEGLKALFLHLASAVLDPPPDLEGTEDGVIARPDRWSLALWAAAEQVQHAMDQESAGYEAEAHRSLGELFGMPYPVLPSEPLRVLLVLDVHQGPPTQAIQLHWPGTTTPAQVIELHKDCGGPRLPGDLLLTADHWNQIAAAVSRMASQAQAMRPKMGCDPEKGPLENRLTV